MSDTIPDVIVSKDVYVDLNTLSSIVAGTAVVLENKSNTPIRLQIAVAQPAADSVDGNLLGPATGCTSIKFITAGENTIWGKSVEHRTTSISVQDNT